eukprot:3727101-Amphidinium_carterae.1
MLASWRCPLVLQYIGYVDKDYSLEKRLLTMAGTGVPLILRCAQWVRHARFSLALLAKVQKRCYF